MKIGVLLCGDVLPALIEEFGDYSNCLQNALNLNDHGDVVEWHVHQTSSLPDMTDLCDAYVIGGSPVGVNDDVSWIAPLSIFIQHVFAQGKKLFGICFGHQIIHYALGGVVKKSHKGWGIGPYEVTFLQPFKQMKVGEKMSLLAIHQDQVVKVAPLFNIIAGSSFCPNYITQCGKQALTVQGHPEFDFSFFSALMGQRSDILSDHVVHGCIAKGNSHIDRVCFNKMVQGFLFEEWE